MLNRKHLLATSVVFFLGLAGTIAVSQQPAPRDASIDGEIQRAQTLYEGGRSSDALAVVEGVLEKASGDAEARFLQGLIFADLNRREDAIRVFTALTDDYPELPEPWNNLAVLFAESGEFDKARQALLAAIQTHPSYSTAHENLGDLYARMASMAYDRALEQDRGNESARLKLSAVNGLFSVPAAPAVQVAAATPPAVSEPAPVVTRPVASEPVATTPPPRTDPPVSTVARTEPAPEPATVQPADPAPEPVRPSTSSAATVRSDVENAIESWAASWSAQDVDGYLASYGPSFRPANGASRASWNRYRRERLTKPSFIQVDVSDLSVELLDDNRASASFNQRYRSDNYEDQVRKKLTMVLNDGRWQIAAEASE